jgi:hypothetical protein
MPGVPSVPGAPGVDVPAVPAPNVPGLSGVPSVPLPGLPTMPPGVDPVKPERPGAVPIPMVSVPSVPVPSVPVASEPEPSVPAVPAPNTPVVPVTSGVANVPVVPIGVVGAVSAPPMPAFGTVVVPAGPPTWADTPAQTALAMNRTLVRRETFFMIASVLVCDGESTGRWERGSATENLRAGRVSKVYVRDFSPIMKKLLYVLFVAVLLGSGSASAHRFHGGFGHHHHFHGGATIVFGGPLLFGYPAFAEPYPPVEPAPPPSVYVERATIDEIRQQPNERYFCPDYGYYPTVQNCPTGWMLVTPAPQ